MVFDFCPSFVDAPLVIDRQCFNDFSGDQREIMPA